MAGKDFMRTDCCPGLECIDKSCDTRAVPCGSEDAQCEEDRDCCEGLVCVDGVSCEPWCMKQGGPCGPRTGFWEDDCCSDLECVDSICQ